MAGNGERRTVVTHAARCAQSNLEDQATAAPIAAGTHWRLRNLDSGVPVLRSGLQVLTVEETLQRIIVDGRSVARFGDGELRLATRALGIGFQASSPALASALAEVARTQDPRLEVCVPGIFGSLKDFTPEAQLIWRKHLLRERGRWVRLFDPAVTYGNAFLSRPYIDWDLTSTTTPDRPG